MSDNALITVIIAFDMHVYAQKLEELICDWKGIKQIHILSRINDILTLLQQHQTVMLLMHDRLPGISSANDIKALLSNHPRMRTLIFYSANEAPYIKALLALKAAGCISEKASCENVKKAIRLVFDGNTYVENLIPASMADAQNTAQLSSREQEVIYYLKKQHKAQYICDQMKITNNTYRSYRHQIINKIKKVGFQNIPAYLDSLK
jgi:DNA-binding NarL/FixJ family response regulator